MEQNYDGQSIAINQKMNIYNFNGKNSILTINESISNLTINGTRNKIIFKARIPNVIINGSKNELDCEHKNSQISNLILNGGHNQINCNRRNSSFNKIDNGGNNIISVAGEANSSSQQQTRSTSGTNFNFGNQAGNPFNNQFFNNFSNSNSNYSIRINNNFGNLDPNNIMDFVNNITRNLNVQINQPGRGQQQNVNVNQYFDDQSDSDGEHEEMNEEEANEEEYRQYMIKRREELLSEMDQFQYKHANKYVSRKEDMCAICLDKFKSKDMVKQFPCMAHIFHDKCLDSWLEKSNYCPLCKFDIMEENDDDIVVEDGN